MRGKKGRAEFDKLQNRANAEKSTFTANMKYKRKETQAGKRLPGESSVKR